MGPVGAQSYSRHREYACTTASITGLKIVSPTSEFVITTIARGRSR